VGNSKRLVGVAAATPVGLASADLIAASFGRRASKWREPVRINVKSVVPLSGTAALSPTPEISGLGRRGRLVPQNEPATAGTRFARSGGLGEVHGTI
jgi:hypothetical protein